MISLSFPSTPHHHIHSASLHRDIKKMQLTKYLLLATTMSTAVSARIGVTQNCVGPPGYEAVSMCKKAGGTQVSKPITRPCSILSSPLISARHTDKRPRRRLRLLPPGTIEGRPNLQAALQVSTWIGAAPVHAYVLQLGLRASGGMALCRCWERRGGSETTGAKGREHQIDARCSSNFWIRTRGCGRWNGS